MIDIDNPIHVISKMRSFVRAGMSSPLYAPSIETMRLAERYRMGDQTPPEFKGDRRHKIIVMNTLASDLNRLAAMAVNGRTKVRLYPKDDASSDIQDIIAAEIESWQYFEDFSGKMGKLAYNMFDKGLGGTRLSVDPYERVGQNLPRIVMQLPEPTHFVVDPAANDPTDPLLGGRYAILFDFLTIGDVEAYWDSAEKTFARVKAMAEDQNRGTTYDMERIHPRAHPLSDVIYRMSRSNITPNLDPDSIPIAPEDKDNQIILSCECVWRDYVRWQYPDGTSETRKVWVRAQAAARSNDFELTDAVLLDVAVLDYQNLPTLILTCTNPPYGMPVAAMIRGIIDANNMANSAALNVVSHIADLGMTMGIIKQAWSPEQLAVYEKSGVKPKLILFDAQQIAEYGLPANVDYLMGALRMNFPGLNELLTYPQILDRKREEILSTPWAIQGQASPASRTSGAALSMLQQGALMAQEIMGKFLGRSGTHHIRAVFGMMRRHWTAYHRVTNPGLTTMRLNGIISDPEIANYIYKTKPVIDGQPVRITAVRAIAQNGKEVIQPATFPVSQDLNDLLNDPNLEILATIPNVWRVVWVINGIETANFDVDFLTEMDSAVRDNEMASRVLQAMQLNPTLLSEEAQFRGIFSGRPEMSWEKNQNERIKDERIRLLLQLPPEQLDAILNSILESQGQTMGAAAPPPATAPMPPAPATQAVK